jgi:dTDP-4-dehydrorhamnose reductase
VVVGTFEESWGGLRILVTGAAGQVGSDLVRLASSESHREVIGASHRELDVADRDQVLGAVMGLHPDIIFHPAAWTAVDLCESQPDRAWRVNSLGARNVAEAARRAGAHLVFVSTDYVFDGMSPEPYTEWDEPRPISVYGRSKLGGERETIAGCPGATLVRTSWVWGPNGSNLMKTVLRLARSGEVFRFVDDQRGCPTYSEDLAGKLLELGLGRAPGIFHVTNQGATTRFAFAREILRVAGLDPDLVQPIRISELDPPAPAARPTNSVLDNAALRAGGMEPLPHHVASLERVLGARV